MSAATSLLTPDEQFIQEVLRSGRATRQEVSLKAIGTPDVNLQARVVHLDMDHCSRLERAAMEQGNLAPIVLFRASQAKAKSKLWLADGHHRHHVYVNMLKPKRQSIPAIVIDSDAPEQEALEFATMCNREMCLGRKPEDIAKAVEMLLMTELWRERSDYFIGDHVGCSNTKVASVRALLGLKMGWAEPEFLISKNGRRKPHRIKFNKTEGGRTIHTPKNRPSSSLAMVNGKQVWGTPETVSAKVAEIQGDLQNRRKSLSLSVIGTLLGKCGFIGSNPCGGGYPGLRGFYRSGIVCLPCDFSSQEVLPMVIGQLIAAQEYKEPTARMIVLCYVEDGPKAMIDLYRRKGFEFMTRDELVESLKGGA